MSDSNFVSVLKKIGQVLLNGGAIATEIMGFPFVSQLLGQYSPRVLGTVQVGISDFNTLSSIATMLETAFPTTGSGSQRVAAGAPLIQQSVLLWAQSNLPGHNSVKDPAKLATACANLLGAWADIMNSFGA
jgi:hypothetical protein